MGLRCLLVITLIVDLLKNFEGKLKLLYFTRIHIHILNNESVALDAGCVYYRMTSEMSKALDGYWIVLQTNVVVRR